MTVKVEEAFVIVNERIAAASQAHLPDEGALVGGLTDDQVRLVLSGLDLDVDDLLELAEEHAKMTLITSMMAGAPPTLAIAGVFFQAFTAGMIYRDLQKKAGQE